MSALVGTNSDDTIEVTDGGTIVAQGGDDIICDASGGDTHIVAGTGDDTVVYKYSADREDSEYLGGSGVDTLRIEINASDLTQAMLDELAAYEAFLDSVIKNDGEATGQWFTFEELNLLAKQFENIELVVIPDESTDLGTQTGSDSVAGPNGQDIVATLTTQEFTYDGTADADVTVTFGAPVQPQINVVLTFDNSGSTQLEVSGATVGDVNDDGFANSVLDIEIAALNALVADIAAQGFADGAVTISLISFDVDANILGTVTLDGNDGTTIAEDLAEISAILNDEVPEGTTNYVDALAATDAVLDGLDAAREDTNLVYFLSDGNPVPAGSQSPGTLSAAAAAVQATAISAFGIGNTLDPVYLNAIDSSGTATFVSDPNELAGTLLAEPVSGATIVDAFIFTEDGDGTVSSFDITSLLVSDGFGLSFTGDIDDLTGLDPDLGDSGTMTLQVNLDTDGIAGVDETLEVALTIDGLMPELLC